MDESKSPSTVLSVPDSGLVAPLFCFVAGLCLYAAFDHLMRTGSRRKNGIRAVLTVLAFLVVGWAMAGLASYKAGSAPPVHMFTLKWVLILPILSQIAFVWFAAYRTERRPMAVLWALTAAHAAVLILHVASPLGLFFSDVKSVSVVDLPWGKAIVQWRVASGPVRGLMEATFVLAVAYCVYACIDLYRRGERRLALALGATGLLLFAGNLHDVHVLGSTYVAPYGFLGTVLAVIIARSSRGGESAGLGKGGIAGTRYARRRMASPVGGTVLILMLVLLARRVEEGPLFDVVVLLAALAIMLTTIRVLYSVASGKRVRRTLVLGVCVCVFSQMLSLTAGLPLFDGVPLLGAASEYNGPGQDFFLLAGLLLLLNAFYYAGVEAGEMRENLIREHRRLTEEIAERKRVEAALVSSERELRASEKRFRALIEKGTDIIAVLEEDGTIRFASASLRRALGYSPEAAVGRSVFAALHPDDTALARAILREVSQPTRERGHIEVRVRHRDGSWRNLEGIVRGMLDDPTLHGIILNARDVTERRQAEERMRYIKTWERERIRRDLHDSIGQDLTGLRCMAESLAKRLHGLGIPEAKRAADMVEGIRRAQADVQAAIKGISPVEPDPDGLRVALEQLVSRVGAENGIAVRLDCPAPVCIEDNATAIHLFRIAQEALTNAVRHARPQNISVTLAREGAAVLLRVCDDGIGINGSTTSHTGQGMRTMRDRAEAIGAVLHIESGERGGTCVACRLGPDTGEQPALREREPEGQLHASP